MIQYNLASKYLDNNILCVKEVVHYNNLVNHGVKINFNPVFNTDEPLETSIWQLTVQERKNAAAFIEYTTVRPFIFLGYSFKCFFCKEYNADLSIILEHTSSHPVEDKKVIFENHIPKGKRAIQVDISDLKCRICGQNYQNLNSIREHLTNSHEKIFLKASNGMTEYTLKVGSDTFLCHICEKSFHNFRLLYAHMNCHVGKVVCETCGAGFLNQHFLMKHKDTHEFKKYQCKVCNKEFFKRSQLVYHRQIEHEGKNRVVLKKCPKCPERFKEHYSKVVHLKEVHGISRTFECHICKSSFNMRRTLTEHINRYHTEKFKCDICSKCFGIESKLKMHLRSHTGERKHICIICKNAYMYQNSLKKHMKSHNSGDFVCIECSRSFNTKIDYSKHFKQWHPDFKGG